MKKTKSAIGFVGRFMVSTKKVPRKYQHHPYIFLIFSLYFPYFFLKKSLYSKKAACKEAFADLIENADAKFILMSYSNEGIIPDEFIYETLGKKGKVKVHKQDYRRFRTERDHEKRQYKVPDDRVTELIYCVKSS